MAEEPKDPIDAYDAAHGNPAATPDAPRIDENAKWGESLNPVRDTPMAAANLKTVGK